MLLPLMIVSSGSGPTPPGPDPVQFKPQIGVAEPKRTTALDSDNILDYQITAFLSQVKSTVGALGVEPEKVFLKITRDWRSYVKQIQKKQDFLPPLVAITLENFTPATDRMNLAAAARSGVHHITAQEDGTVTEFKPVPFSITGRFIIMCNDRKHILTLIPYIAWGLAVKLFSFKVTHDRIPGGLTCSVYSEGNAPSFALPDGKMVELEDNDSGDLMSIDLPFTIQVMFGVFNKVPVVLNLKTDVQPKTREQMATIKASNAVTHD